MISALLANFRSEGPGRCQFEGCSDALAEADWSFGIGQKLPSSSREALGIETERAR
jgi:hypothetical protein